MDGRAFWPNGRNDGENCLAQNRASQTSFILHSICRPHRRQRSGLLDSNSCEREGYNSLVDRNREEEWWCYSMFCDSVPGEITGLDQWEYLGEGKGYRWWRGKCGSHLREWWCFSPTVQLWVQQVSLGQLMTSDTQAVAGILSYVPWPSSSQCWRQLHYWGPSLHWAADLLPSVKDEWGNHPGSTCF